MKNYKCKIATMEEILEKMDYEISIHPKDERWKIWKEEANKVYKTVMDILSIEIKNKLKHPFQSQD